MELLYQCTLSQGTTRTIGYIPERAASIGKIVEIKDDGFEGFWRVESVSDKASPKEVVKRYDEMSRNAFGSIHGQKAAK